MNLNKELKARWKRYVESYGYDTSKKIHLISATHVVNRIIDTATDSHENRNIQQKKKNHSVNSGGSVSECASMNPSADTQSDEKGDYYYWNSCFDCGYSRGDYSMRIIFKSWDEEAEEIKAGKKSITRKIDRYNLIFKELEEINSQMALAKIDPEDPYGKSTFPIEIQDKDGRDIANGIISKISYFNGNVIVEWVTYEEHKNLNKLKA